MNTSGLAERLSAFAPSHRRVSTVPRGRSVPYYERLPFYKGDVPLFEGTFLLHIREKDTLSREFSTDTKEVFGTLREMLIFSGEGRGACALVS